MTINQVLERATGEQAIAAIKYSPFWELEAQGWELYRGKVKIGGHRNLFWYNPTTKVIAIDYIHMAHMITDFISSITPSRLRRSQIRFMAYLGS